VPVFAEATNGNSEAVRPRQPTLPKVKQELICNLGDHQEGLLAKEHYLPYRNKLHIWMTTTEPIF